MTELQPRLITDGNLHYDMVEWGGVNTSGIRPFGDRVLILPDQPATKYGSILLPPVEIERAALAAETGVLVACGDGAWFWNSDRTRKYEGAKPMPGESSKPGPPRMSSRRSSCRTRSPTTCPSSRPSPATRSRTARRSWPSTAPT